MVFWIGLINIPIRWEGGHEMRRHYRRPLFLKALKL